MELRKTRELEGYGALKLTGLKRVKANPRVSLFLKAVVVDDLTGEQVPGEELG